MIVINSDLCAVGSTSSMECRHIVELLALNTFNNMLWGRMLSTVLRSDIGVDYIH